MGDRDRRRAETLDAVDDEIVDDVGHGGEAGRRLVEEDDPGSQ
jgi:hypothetical protein